MSERADFAPTSIVGLRSSILARRRTGSPLGAGRRVIVELADESRKEMLNPAEERGW
jgi:hypothetical protein